MAVFFQKAYLLNLNLIKIINYRKVYSLHIMIFNQHLNYILFDNEFVNAISKWIKIEILYYHLLKEKGWTRKWNLRKREDYVRIKCQMFI